MLKPKTKQIKTLVSSFNKHNQINKFQHLFVGPQIKHQKNMVHLSQKPSFNRGNQNVPKCNPFTTIPGTIKIVCSIAKSHDDQNVKRNKTLLLLPMHNQKWEVGWTLPSTTWTQTQCA
jgi:hypothetical protein